MIPSADAPRPAAAETHWHGTPPGRLRLRSWRGEAGVVYDTHTGDTHWLDALPFELLHLLQRGPLSTDAVLDALAGLIEAPDSLQARRGVEGGLKMLQDLGLVSAHGA